MTPPLSLRLHQARMRIIKAVNDAASDNELTANLMEGVLSDVLSDIRAQSTAELILDMSSSVNEKSKEGKSE